MGLYGGNKKEMIVAGLRVEAWGISESGKGLSRVLAVEGPGKCLGLRKSWVSVRFKSRMQASCSKVPIR